MRTWVVDNAVVFSDGIVNLVDQLPFAVRLIARHIDAESFPVPLDLIFQIAERFGAIDLRFAHTEHVEVRPIENENLFRLHLLPLSLNGERAWHP